MSLEGTARLRQGVYRLLALGFSYPSPRLVETAAGAPAALDAYGLFDFSFSLDVVEASAEVARSSLEELEVAYIALFEAGLGGTACSLFESDHLADPRLGQVAEVRSAVRRTLLRFGLTLEGTLPDMVDHLSTELDAMALLCSREVTDWETSGRPGRSLSHQRELFEDHLGRWAPSLARQVRDAARHPAYTALAAALAAFVEHERQWLPRLVETAEALR